MSLAPPLSPEFQVLLMRQLDGDITAAEESRLGALLEGDAAARRHFLQLMEVHAVLEWDSLALPETAATAQARACPATASGFASSLETSGLPRAVLRSAVNYLSSPVRFGVFFAVVSMVSLLLLFAQIRISNNNGPAGHAHALGRGELPDRSLARLTGALQCEWANQANAPQVSEGLATGTWHELRAGLAEVQLENLATILLEGPVTFAVQDARTVYLQEGRLTARLEGPTAKGFTVVTPQALVVDRGTEFGVTVDDEGRAEVAVFEGRVEALLRQGGSPKSRVGQQVARDYLIVQEGATRWSDVRPLEPADRDRYRRRMPRGSSPKVLVDAAFAMKADELPVKPLRDDLLTGLVAASGISVAQPLERLTDGQSPAPYGMTDRHESHVYATKNRPWQLTYDLERLTEVHEIRVFSHNKDARVFQDYTLEMSLDGSDWQLLHSRVTNGMRGRSVNWPDDQPGDACQDFSVTTVKMADRAVCRFLRFKFNPVLGSALGNHCFATEGREHTALFEIDVLGRAVLTALERASPAADGD